MRNLTLPRNFQEMGKRQCSRKLVRSPQNVWFGKFSVYYSPWFFWSLFLSLEEVSGNSLESSCQIDSGCVHDVTTGIKLNVKEILSPSSTIANRHHHLHISPFRDKKNLILCFRILVDLVPVNCNSFPFPHKSRIWNIPTDLFLGHLGLWKYSIFSYNLYQLASKEWN